MKKIIPVLNILLFFFVIIWCVQKYLNNGFQDLTDFIIPIVLIILFLYDLYSSKKGKFEEANETELREEKAFNYFCYTVILCSLFFQYFNNRLDWSDLILPSIILLTILFPKLEKFI